MSASVVIQQPEGAPGQLILLFHGIGGVPENLMALGRRLAEKFPVALIVSVSAPDRFEYGAGYQWFSIAGVTEENRPTRVTAAMPAFRAEVMRWQAHGGVTAAATALIGFSQGAIMCLESTQQGEPLAGRVISLSGRYATPPQAAPKDVTLHFIHGKTDAVIHYGHTVRSAERLVQLGADVTADVIPFHGHDLDEEIIELVVDRLTGYVPKRLWDDALSSEASLMEGEP